MIRRWLIKNFLTSAVFVLEKLRSCLTPENDPHDLFYYNKKFQLVHTCSAVLISEKSKNLCILLSLHVPNFWPISSPILLGK